MAGYLPFGVGTPAEVAEQPPSILDKLATAIINGTAALPKRVIDAAVRSRPGLRREDVTDIPGSAQPNDPLYDAVGETALNLAGVASPFATSGAVGALGGKIKAYHGSPHDFDRFDLSKIGTGEGAQAYGHGLYFAENEGVARSYKAAGQPAYLGADRIEAARKLLEQHGGNRLAAMNAADANMRATKNYGEGKLWQDVINNFDNLSGKTPGRMYEVNINADPKHFLDWDKPLAGQSQHVNSSVGSALRLTQRERETLPTRSVLEMIGPSVEASSRLNQAGIPGIKYLDQGSRGAGAGSSNYVVFDDKLIDILRKYGLAGAAPVGALAMGSGQPDGM